MGLASFNSAKYTKHAAMLHQGQSGLFELLCLSRRAGKERVVMTRPGAQDVLSHICKLRLSQNIPIFDLLKKITAIFLLLQFLTNNSFAEELIKLPKLFTHYYHHSYAHHDQRNFTDYLVLHYSGNHVKDEHRGEEGDCNLPFKHCNNCCMSAHAPVLAFIPSAEIIDFGFVTAIAKHYTTTDDKIFNISSPPVWQPPKFA